jgi:hypothetical protein
VKLDGMGGMRKKGARERGEKYHRARNSAA